MTRSSPRAHNISGYFTAIVFCLTMLGGVAHAAPFAYIPHEGASNTGNAIVDVIDTATNSVVANVPVGVYPEGVAVNPDGTRAYVANNGIGSAGSISVIDTVTNTVVATIPTSYPEGIAMNPAGTRVYVAHPVIPGGPGFGGVSVIDTASNTTVATVTWRGQPRRVAVNPDGTRAYVTGGNVTVIDTATNTVVATVAVVGNDPRGIAINSTGTRAYVANFRGEVAVIDTATNTVVASVVVIPVAGPPTYPHLTEIALNPAGTRAYVVHASDGGNSSIAVIDTATNTVVATVPVAGGPTGVGVNPAGTHVYVPETVDGINDRVLVIDTATNTVTATVAVGRFPHVTGLFIGGPVTAPGAPTIGTATPGDRQAEISFTPPASDGGSPITGYTATCNPGVFSARGAASPLTVTGLAGGTTYSCSVTATNAVGTGAASASVNVTPLTVPGAPTLGAPLAYIINTGDNYVSVLDIAGNTVVGTVPINSGARGVAINPAGTRAYVTNSDSNAVLVIDIATSTLIATVAVGDRPYGVAVNPAGTRVYVTNAGTIGSNGSVSVIDTATNSVVTTVPVGLIPEGVAVHPAGTWAYVINGGSSSVSVIDTATNTVSATVSMGTFFGTIHTSEGVTINPAGTRLYVANQYRDNVLVIDTATNTVIATVAVGTTALGIAINPAGTRVYVTNAFSSNVSVIDTATNTVVATVAVGTTAQGIAINPAGTRVYVTNAGTGGSNGSVSVIDTATNTVVDTVEQGRLPASIAVFTTAVGAAIPGDGQATISFTPPASDGGLPITGYTATCDPGLFGANIIVNGAASPLVVTGLTNGTTYACSLTASNAIGTGPASATVNVTPNLTVNVIPNPGITSGGGSIGWEFILLCWCGYLLRRRYQLRLQTDKCSPDAAQRNPGTVTRSIPHYACAACRRLALAVSHWQRRTPRSRARGNPVTRAQDS